MSSRGVTPGNIHSNWSANTLATASKSILSRAGGLDISLHCLETSNNQTIIMVAIEFHKDCAMNSARSVSTPRHHLLAHNDPGIPFICPQGTNSLSTQAPVGLPRTRASRSEDKAGLHSKLRLSSASSSKERGTERFSVFLQKALGATDLQKQFPSATCGTMRARNGRSCCNCSKRTPRQGTPCT
eukprot:4363187-Amphidinium_carterae.1